jgi:hypothetical protein
MYLMLNVVEMKHMVEFYAIEQLIMMMMMMMSDQMHHRY